MLEGLLMSGAKVNFLPFIVISTIILSSFSPLLDIASATGGQGFTNTFADGSPSITLDLDGNMTNSSTGIILDRNTTINNATFDISYNYAIDSPSPGEVTLDIGNDTQYEWAWNSLGYGDFGRQTLFSTGANFSGAPVNSSGNIIAEILLPSHAQVQTTDLVAEFSPNFGGGWFTTGAINDIAVGDVDGNNLSEPIFLQNGHNWANGSNSSAIGTIIWNSSNGFSNVSWTPICDGASSIKVADFNGDNFSDVVAMDDANESACLLISLSNGSWASNTNLSLGMGASAIATGDLNNDGNAELISIHSTGDMNEFVYDNQNAIFVSSSSTTVLRNGTMPGAAILGSIAVGDFWGQGYNTVVVSDIQDGHVTMWNSSLGSWNQANPSTEFDCIKSGLHTVDWNMDGFLDLIGDVDEMSNGGICTATFNGTGWNTNFSNSTQLSNYAVGDWSGNGGIEILQPLVGNIDGNDSTLNGSLQVYSFGVNGSLQTSSQTLYPHTAPRDAILIDMDGDGILEQIVYAGESSLGLFIAGWHTATFDIDMNNYSEGSLVGYAGDGQNGVDPFSWFDTLQSVATTLAANLSFSQTYPNTYGTPITTLRAIGTSIGSGTLTLKDMNITYSISITVTNNPSAGNLSNSINSQMECCSGTFNLSFPFNSTSQGVLTVNNLNVDWVAGMSAQVFRDAPVFLPHMIGWDPILNEHVVVLEWDDLALSESDFQEFQLFRWENGTTPNLNTPLSTPNNLPILSNMSFDNLSVSNNTWDYVVRTVYHNNAFSNYSEVKTVVVPPILPPDNEPPEEVEIVNATDVGGDGGGVIEVSWPTSNSSDISWYALYVDSSQFSSITNQTEIANFSIIDNTTSFLYNTSGDGIEYYFGVVCGDLVGNVNWNVTTTGPVYSRNNSVRSSNLIFSLETGLTQNAGTEVVATAGSPLFINGTITSMGEPVGLADYSILVESDAPLPSVQITGVSDSNGEFNHSWADWLDFESEHSPLRGQINATATFAESTWGLDNQTLGASESNQQFTAITEATLSTNFTSVQLDENGIGVVTIILQAEHAVEQSLLTGLFIDYNIGNESNQAVSESGNLQIDSNGEVSVPIGYLIGGELDVSIPIPPPWLSLNSTTVRVILLPPPTPEEPEDNTTTPGPDLDLKDLLWTCEDGVWEVTENGSSVGKSCTVENTNDVLVHAELVVAPLNGLEMVVLPTTATIFSNNTKNLQLSIKALDGKAAGDYVFEVDIFLTAAGYNSTSSYETVSFTVLAKQVAEGGNGGQYQPPPSQQNQGSPGMSTTALAGIGIILVALLAAGVFVVRTLTSEGKYDEEDDDYLDEYDDYDYDEYGEGYEEPPQTTRPPTREKPKPVTSIQSEWQEEEEYEEYDDEYDDGYAEDDYTDSEGYHVDDEGVEWWEDELGVWWYRYPDEDDWSEFIE